MAISDPGGLELGQKLRTAQCPSSGYRGAQGERLEQCPFHLGCFFPNVFTYYFPCLHQADSKQTTVVLTDCLGSICSSGAVIYKVLPKS